MTDLITQNTPAADPKESKPEKRSVPLLLVIGVPLAAAALVAGVWSGASSALTHADTALKLSNIADTLNTNKPTSDQNTMLFGDPKITAFRSDPVFRSPEWVAYADLSAPATRDARVSNLNTAKADAEKLSSADSKAKAETRITVYQAFIDGGGIDQSREDDQEADAIRLTQKACQAGPGAPASAYVASWKLDGSNPRPTALLQSGADHAAADAVIQKAYVAAMTAGIKHLCP